LMPAAVLKTTTVSSGRIPPNVFSFFSGAKEGQVR
jgi:hypothetical protein